MVVNGGETVVKCKWWLNGDLMGFNGIYWDVAQFPRF
jgi:hypothetical protein